MAHRVFGAVLAAEVSPMEQPARGSLQNAPDHRCRAGRIAETLGSRSRKAAKTGCEKGKTRMAVDARAKCGSPRDPGSDPEALAKEPPWAGTNQGLVYRRALSPCRRVQMAS